MANIAIFRINYKSDFILTLNSDAGWLTPFCIKFWTGAPSQAYFASFDGTTYTHCAPVEGEPTKLQVQFDDHHLPIGDLQFQIGYHFTVEDFPTSVEDEVLNQASVIIEVGGEPAQVMLDFNGETAPEIEFSLPAYANEAQRIANEQERIAAEEVRIQNEETRISAEQVRQQNETQRISREQARQTNETQRIEREQARQSNEEQRIANEAERVTEFAGIKTEAVAATNAANTAASLANEKAEYAQAQGDYAKEQGDTALADHERAEADHTTAAADHTQAVADHTQADSDHTRAESDHTRAESDHAAVEVYVDSLGAFDISAYHATGGVLAKYADLAAALDSNNGGGVPQSLQKGGMSVKFVQSSDNKYVQYRLMAQNYTTDVTQWQGVDDEPTAGSENLIKSSGVENFRKSEFVVSLNNNGYLTKRGKFYSITNGWKTTDYFSVLQGSVISLYQHVNVGDYCVYYYDKDFNFLPNISPISESSTPENKTFIVPSGVCYARVHSFSTDAIPVSVNNTSLFRICGKTGEEIQDVKNELKNECYQVIKPSNILSWNDYNATYLQSNLIANVQNKTVSIKGVRIKTKVHNDSTDRKVSIYYLDRNDTSSLTLLKEYFITKEITTILFDSALIIGGSKQIFLGGNVSYKITQNDNGILYYNTENDQFIEANNVIFAYELILDTTISDRIEKAEDNIAQNTSDIARITKVPASIISKDSFVSGCWYMGDFNTGGNWGKCKTHQNALLLQECAVYFYTEQTNNTYFGIVLYDENMQPLANYPNGVHINGTYVIRPNEIRILYPSAHYFRVNFSNVNNGSYEDFPTEYNIGVYQKLFKQTLVVDQNGCGDYISITDAVNNAYDDSTHMVDIFVNSGIYDEHIKVGCNRFLHFVGQNRETTIMQSHTGQYVDSPIWIDGDFCIENMTLKMLDDEAPEDWVPGSSQTDRQTMLPGYALHVDGGNGNQPAMNGEYKLGVIRNCNLYSVASAALGCGVHANNKVIFEGCQFVRNVINSAYLSDSAHTSDLGAFLIHDEIGSPYVNQNIEIINCRFYTSNNQNVAAKIDITHSDDTSHVTLKCIDNSFYAGGTENSSISLTLSNATLHKISHGNNNELLNT